MFPKNSHFDLQIHKVCHETCFGFVLCDFSDCWYCSNQRLLHWSSLTTTDKDSSTCMDYWYVMSFLIRPIFFFLYAENFKFTKQRNDQSHTWSCEREKKSLTFYLGHKIVQIGVFLELLCDSYIHLEKIVGELLRLNPIWFGQGLRVRKGKFSVAAISPRVSNCTFRFFDAKPAKQSFVLRGLPSSHGLIPRNCHAVSTQQG